MYGLDKTSSCGAPVGRHLRASGRCQVDIHAILDGTYYIGTSPEEETEMPRPQRYSIDKSMLLFGNIRYINRNCTHVGPRSGGRPLMPPSNRAAYKATTVAHRRGRRDGDDPPGHGVDGGTREMLILA